MSHDMLDQEISIAGWRAAWINRSLPLFINGSNILSYALSISICILGLVGYFGIRRCTAQLHGEPDNRAAIFKRINNRVLKVCKGHWYIAQIYLFSATAIALVDAYIGVTAITQDVTENPADYDTAFWLYLAAYSVYLMAIFMTTLIIVPMLQVLAATWVLARYMRKRGVTTLSDYLPEARMYSTHIAQLWCMIVFFVVAWWAPMGSHTMLRYVIIEGCVGSSLAWLDASFAFNFCHKRLADKDFDLSSTGIKAVLAMFADTVAAAHTFGKGEKDTLPHHEQATTKPAAEINEKTPLTVVEAVAEEERQIDL